MRFLQTLSEKGPAANYFLHYEPGPKNRKAAKKNVAGPFTSYKDAYREANKLLKTEPYKKASIQDFAVTPRKKAADVRESFLRESRSPNAAYEETLIDVVKKLKELKDELINHHQMQAQNSNWDRVGDISHVKEELDHLVEFISGNKVGEEGIGGMVASPPMMGAEMPPPMDMSPPPPVDDLPPPLPEDEECMPMESLKTFLPPSSKGFTALKVPKKKSKGGEIMRSGEDEGGGAEDEEEVKTKKKPAFFTKDAPNLFGSKK